MKNLLLVMLALLAFSCKKSDSDNREKSLIRQKNASLAGPNTALCGFAVGNVDEHTAYIGGYYMPTCVFPSKGIILQDTTVVWVGADTFYVKKATPAFVRPEAPLYVWGTGSDGLLHTYNKSSITTPPMNVPTAMTTKSLNTAYQISTTLDYEIEVSVKMSCQLSLTSGQSGTIVLEISPNGTSGWIYKGQLDGSNTGTLTVGLNTSQITGGQLKSGLPRGYYWRLRTVNNTGTPTFSWSGGSQQEI